MEKSSPHGAKPLIFLEAETGQNGPITGFNEQVRSLERPNMTSDWGCMTAAGAFVHNLLRPDHTTPAQLDKIIGREPDMTGNTQLIDLWHLQNGLGVETYHHDSLYEDFFPYLRGEISYQEYFALYEEAFGPVESTEDREILWHYNENVMKPAYAGFQQAVEPYRNNGQYAEINQNPSPELLANLVNQGKLVYVTQIVSNMSTHVLVVFKPSPDHPAAYFYPDVSPQNGGGGSDIYRLTAETLDTLAYEEFFRAISRR